MWDQLIDQLDRSYDPVFEQHAADREDIASYQESFSERARGFYKAANLILDTVAANHNLYNAEMIPAALALYRHAIELHLKAMRGVLAKKIPSTFEICRGHNLAELWGPIESYLSSSGLTFEDGQLHYRVAQVIKEFNYVDEYGDRFRYPDSRSSQAQNWLGGNFFALKLAVSEVDLFGFGFLELVSSLDASRSNLTIGR